MNATKEEIKEFQELWRSWQKDWVKFAYEALRVRLSEDQKTALRSVQHNKQVSICSGTAFGKDFLGSVISVCFLLLTPFMNKDGVWETATVINSGPTQRQVIDIMMREVRSRYAGSIFPVLRQKFGVDFGTLTKQGISFNIPNNGKDLDDPTNPYCNYGKYYMKAFKASDHNTEAWTGIHNTNTLFVLTEASGLSQTLFEGVFGNLQENSKLVLLHNPNVCSGEAYNSMSDKQYVSHRFSSLNLPNVKNGLLLKQGKITKEEYDNRHFHGQVDYNWVNDMLHKKGWAMVIPESEMDESKSDFKFGDECFRPTDIAKIKILGKHPESGNTSLIPIGWIEAAEQRWLDYHKKNKIPSKQGAIRGADIAGLGVDKTIFCDRLEDFVFNFEEVPNFNPTTYHSDLASMISQDADTFDAVFIDTIGEGAGVYSNCKANGNENVFMFKNSLGASGLTDETRTRKFHNMRAYCYWMLRDWLDPQFESNAMLPPNDGLKAQLVEIHWEFRKDKILIEDKAKIKERLGHSPDEADALAQTFAPKDRCVKAIQDKEASVSFAF